MDMVCGVWKCYEKCKKNKFYISEKTSLPSWKQIICWNKGVWNEKELNSRLGLQEQQSAVAKGGSCQVAGSYQIQT